MLADIPFQNIGKTIHFLYIVVKTLPFWEKWFIHLSFMNVKPNVTSNRCLNCHLGLSVSYCAWANHNNDLVTIMTVDMVRHSEKRSKIEIGLCVKIAAILLGVK